MVLRDFFSAGDEFTGGDWRDGDKVRRCTRNRRGPNTHIDGNPIIGDDSGNTTNSGNEINSCNNNMVNSNNDCDACSDNEVNIGKGTLSNFKQSK